MQDSFDVVIIGGGPAGSISGLLPAKAARDRRGGEISSSLARRAAAKRVTPVSSANDYSYRHPAYISDRRPLAGDAVGITDSVRCGRVFPVLAFGEKAAAAHSSGLREHRRRKKLFAPGEKSRQKMKDLYLRFVSAWYSPALIEVISQPTKRLNLPGASNAVLAGNLAAGSVSWWRRQFSYLMVFLQRSLPLCLRLTLVPASQTAPTPVPASCVG